MHACSRLRGYREHVSLFVDDERNDRVTGARRAVNYFVQRSIRALDRRTCHTGNGLRESFSVQQSNVNTWFSLHQERACRNLDAIEQDQSVRSGISLYNPWNQLRTKYWTQNRERNLTECKDQIFLQRLYKR